MDSKSTNNFKMNNMHQSAIHCVLLFSGFVLLAHADVCCADDFFRERVVPVLQRRCLSCHNDVQRKGEFSLQSAESAFDDGYLEPGDAAASHLVDVITPTNGKAEMPKNSDPLKTEEISAIRKWIDSGAKWPSDFKLQEPVIADFDWWSYQPIKSPSVPKINDPWVRTPIDSFVLKTLNQKGLSHAAEADRRTLIRRVTFDLTGLPPTIEEVDAFQNDSDPHAYEKLVDRLLESKHYGERWARHWLDIVKYADTCGYDKDKLRPNAWPYRDYVIRSFNEDKPYARFVQEQIAGDVLFPGEPDGILGLGFIAAGPWDFIGHVEVPESKIDGKVARNLDRDDMVSNTINTFCSMTIQCARCHNHKFDPLTQENYYGLQAIFAAVDRAERPYDLDPKVEKRRRELDSQLKQFNAKLSTLEKTIADAGGPRLLELNQQIKELKPRLKTEKEPQFGYHSAITSGSTTEKWVVVDLGRIVGVSSIVLRACHDDYAGIGSGFGFPIRFKVEISTDGQDWKIVRDQTMEDVPNPGLTAVELDNINLNARHVRVTATKLSERSSDYIFALAELQVFDTNRDNVAHGAKVAALDSIEAPVRWTKKNLTDGLWAKAGDPTLAQQLVQVVKERAEILAKIETPERLKEKDSIQKSITKAQGDLKSLPQGRMVYAAATQFKTQGNFKPTQGTLRPIQVLHRGNVQQPDHPATAGMLPLSRSGDWRIEGETTESQRRAELATWLTDRDHPLVWRSIVNRIWQYHFGQGIVATPNDFGRMGAKPTHPELLDWLAVQFRDGDQSMKQLHRLIVTSGVYRQSSQDNEANSGIDGSNQYLWRMKRRRLEAEEIRDSILTVSGAMNYQMGGPGYYLFELERVEHSPHYEYHKFDPSDEASHRRSIYRFIVRSQPDPWMTTLDCADSSQSTPKRNETLTSLQALSMLNSKFNLLMAERFATQLELESDNLEAQVEKAMLLTTQRKPTELERKQFVAYAQKHGLPNLCRVMFNLSEFVYLD